MFVDGVKSSAKMSDTMVVYRNQLTKRFMVGRSNKNRKERIKQLLRKDNLTTPHHTSPHQSPQGKEYFEIMESIQSLISQKMELVNHPILRRFSEKS